MSGYDGRPADGHIVSTRAAVFTRSKKRRRIPPESLQILRHRQRERRASEAGLSMAEKIALREARAAAQ